MSELEAPQEEATQDQNATGPFSVPNGERWKSWFRMMFAVCVGILLIGDIFLYSLHRSLTARVENQERRIERLQGTVKDLLTARDNAEKIEKIEQQIEGIDGQIGDLTETLKAQNDTSEKTPLTAK